MFSHVFLANSLTAYLPHCISASVAGSTHTSFLSAFSACMACVSGQVLAFTNCTLYEYSDYSLDLACI